MKKTLLTLVALGLFAAACSDSGKDCLEAICEPGSAVCLEGGLYMGTCLEDGKNYKVKYCGDGFHCLGGECVTDGCTPGVSICKGDEAVKTCDGVGSGYQPEQPCVADADGNETVCKYGLCVMETCFAGNKACGVGYILECQADGSGWKELPCEDGQYCDPATITCVEQLCKPGSRVCLNEGSWQGCSADGSKMEAVVSCGADQACSQGFCFDKVCEPGTIEPEKDVVAGDISLDTMVGDTDGDVVPSEVKEVKKDKETTPLEKLNVGTVKVNGEEWKFDLDLSSSYVAEDQRLQISMNKFDNITNLNYQLEITLSPVEEFTVGKYNSEEPGEVTVEVRMNDGTSEPGDPSSWKYTASAFEVTIEDFGPVGGRIIGKFTATLADKDGGPSLTLTEGVFDIKRSN